MVQQQHGSVNLTESLSINADDEEQNNDRELIAEFMVVTREVQQGLTDMESNNEQMRVLVAELITDKKSPAHQKDLQDQISGFLTEN